MTVHREPHPRPGTIGLSRIGGTLGFLIALGQALTGDWSYWTHAFIVIDERTVLQAMPKGAELAPLEPYLAPGKAVFLHGWPELDEYQRYALPYIAEDLEGTPYGFLDYVSLALLGIGIRPKALRRRVADSGHMICSQLVDHVHLRLGAHLFTDGRPSQDVTPGDLLIRFVQAHSEQGPSAHPPHTGSTEDTPTYTPDTR